MRVLLDNLEDLVEINLHAHNEEREADTDTEHDVGKDVLLNLNMVKMMNKMDREDLSHLSPADDDLYLLGGCEAAVLHVAVHHVDADEAGLELEVDTGLAPGDNHWSHRQLRVGQGEYLRNIISFNSLFKVFEIG